MGFFLLWGRTRLLFRRKLLGRLRRCFFRGVLPRPLLFPALTLGCGAVGGSSSSNNISPLDLINIRRVAWDLGESPVVPQGGAAAGAVNAELVELLTEKILQRLGE